jgi:S-adenosylmethionine uptake transporter
MKGAAESPADNTLKGISLCTLGYGLFSIQDALVKWLVADYAVPQILFMRSVIIMVIAGLVGGRSSFANLARSRNKPALLLRAALILVAWMSYYSAARHLGLAQLTTIYFAAPIIVIFLSVIILGETVAPSRWIAVLVGFGGVLLAAKPAGTVDLVPAGMALFAALLWAFSVILIRLINRSETTANQMLASNALFALACAVMLIWLWKTPDLFSLCLMLCLGVAGGLGQFALYEGFRYAPASALAPIEYTGLVWAFVYGYLIWADLPALNVVAGAVLIVASSLSLIWVEKRRAVRLAA